jgi:hypothetical protein
MNSRLTREQLVARKHGEDLPDEVEGPLDGPVVRLLLRQVLPFELVPEGEVALVGSRQLLLADDGGEVAHRLHPGVRGEQLAGGRPCGLPGSCRARCRPS